MGALRLSLPFGTSKMERDTIILRSNGTSKSQRNGTKPKFASHEKERNNPVPQLMVFSQMENPTSSTSLHENTNMSSCLHAMEGQINAHCHVVREHCGGDLHCSLIPMINENGNAFRCLETYTSSSVYLDAAHENGTMNNQRRTRKSQSQKMQEHTGCLSHSLVKYWIQRYSLFSRFDKGIKMDEESWFSVTPESIAKHHASKCGAGTIIDCFAGVGGNAIQFARRSNHVIAIDIDPQKINYAKHNADIYGVRNMINFIEGDFFKIAPNLKGDVVFLAPPWGGPDYAKKRTYDIRLLMPCEGYYLFKIASKIAAKVVMFLPRNVNLDQLKELSLSADPPWKLEIEKNYLQGNLKSITAYFDRTTLE